MAQAGGAAAGGGGAGGGLGAEDVPDVRFLLKSKDVANQYQNSPLMLEITLQEKEALFISFLKQQNVGNDELRTTYRVSDAFNRQLHPAVRPLNAHASVLAVALGRKRRRGLFLMFMVRAFGRGSKFWKIPVPHKYRDLRQLKGDIKALEDGMQSLRAQLHAVCDRVVAIGGVPIKIPDVFERDLMLPNAN